MLKADMTKKTFIILFATLSFIVKGQISTKNGKEIYDNNCTSLKGIGVVMFNDLDITEKEFTDYVAANFNTNFPKAVVELNIVIDSNSKTCCRRLVISDSTKMENKQISDLKNVVLKFPKYNRIKFALNENPKYLTILISADKKGKTKAHLLGGHSAGKLKTLLHQP